MMTQLYFIDVKTNGHPKATSTPICVSFASVIDYSSHAVPLVKTMYVETDEDILRAIKPDVMARNNLSINEFHDHALPKVDVAAALKKLPTDTLCSWDNAATIKAMMKHFDVDLSEKKFIDLTRYITKKVEIDTEQWGPQGYSAPPAMDPLFDRTCFLHIMDESKWSIPDQQDGPRRVIMGAMLVWELSHGCTKLEPLLEVQEHMFDNVRDSQ